MTTRTAAEALEEVLARSKRAIEGPYYVAIDDAEDTGEHRNSGLALVETGRQSDWPVARLCEWETAYFIAAMEDFIRTHADTLRAALATPQPDETRALLEGAEKMLAIYPAMKNGHLHSRIRAYLEENK